MSLRLHACPPGRSLAGTASRAIMAPLVVSLPPNDLRWGDSAHRAETAAEQYSVLLTAALTIRLLQGRDRRLAGDAAPAHALILAQVKYPEEQRPDRARPPEA